jgi:hypothetical protein
MVALSIDTIEELMDRLTEAPQDFTNAEVLAIYKAMADRTGHGPQSRNININLNVDLAARLETARKRVESLSPVMPEGDPAPLAPSGSLLELVAEPISPQTEELLQLAGAA